MFNLENIKKLRMIAIGDNNLSKFIDKMNGIGGDYMIVYIDDCHTEYYSKDKKKVIDPGTQINFMVNTTTDPQKASNAIKKRQKSRENYMEFVYQLAQAGVSYYYISFANAICMFYDSDDVLIHQEDISRNNEV